MPPVKHFYEKCSISFKNFIVLVLLNYLLNEKLLNLAYKIDIFHHAFLWFDKTTFPFFAIAFQHGGLRGRLSHDSLDKWADRCMLTAQTGPSPDLRYISPPQSILHTFNLILPCFVGPFPEATIANSCHESEWLRLYMGILSTWSRRQYHIPQPTLLLVPH